ncbi:MAG: double zinc ribbon domain-containing protein [Thermoproteota archaeon]
MTRLRCPQCNGKIPDFYSYCPQCGLNLQIEYCPNCGDQQIFLSNRCSRCGFTYETPKPPPLPVKLPPPPEKGVDDREVLSIVETEFHVLEPVLGDGYLNFYVLEGFKKKNFKNLVRKLEEKNCVPLLRMKDGHIVLTIGRLPPEYKDAVNFSKIRMRRLWLPLFITTCLTILLSGYMMSSGLAEMKLLNSGIVASTLFFMFSMISIFGVHELGHKFACFIHQTGSTPPYFIPGPPPLGTFGAVIFQCKPLVNKDELFDLGVSGPFAGLGVATIVSAIGLKSSSMTLINTEGLVSVPRSLFFDLIGYLVAPSVPKGYTLVLSPIAYAGWAGFLLTYLQLLPVWQLDGAHVSYAVFGRKSQKFLWAIGLGLVFLSGFFMMAILLLIFMTLQRGSHPELLDEVTPLSNSRKVFYIVVLIATIGCMTR